MKKKYTSDWTKISKKIRKEENHRCTNCGRKDEPNTCYRLEVHHIDGNKHNNSRSNLVALCMICHITYQDYRLSQAMFIMPKWVERHLKRIKMWRLLDEQRKFLISEVRSIKKTGRKTVLRPIYINRVISRRPRSPYI